MLRLAIPVVLAEIGWVAMGVVDVMMVGRIDTESIGAVGLGRAAVMLVTVFGLGVLLGLDTVISRAFGAGEIRECHLYLVHGIYLGGALSLPLILLVLGLAAGAGSWGIDPWVMKLAVPYVEVACWTVPPVLLYVALRRYLQAINLVRPVMIAVLSANLVNVLANWVLIYGNLGAPALGAVGAAWATLFASCYMAAFLAAAVLIHDRGEGGELLRVPLRLDARRLRRLFSLGLPAGLQLVLEFGVFAVVSVLAALLAPAVLAAHQVAINVASVTYMVPLGVSSAAAVRVGQALGRGDRAGAATSGWTALGLGTVFMSTAALVFFGFPGPIIGAFTPDPAVLAAGIGLLYVAAVFQLFDGLQVVAIGALRGAGNTRTPMIWNLVGYWFIALPASGYLCFVAGLGALGLWIGLSVGLILVGSVLLAVWARTSRSWLGDLSA